MGVFDEMKNKGQDIMNDPNTKAKIEQMAKEKGITIDEAKKHFMQKKNQ